MKRKDLYGVYTASVTPINKDRSLDVGAMRDLTEYYIDSGLRGVLLPSSSGEYFAMTSKMKRLCVAEAVKTSNGRFQILANVSDSCPEVILDNIKAMTDIGADAVVCQPPQFHAYSQEECVRFFHYVADNSTLPVIAYSHLSALPTKPTVETVIKICSHENIIGIKDTHREPQRIIAMKEAIQSSDADFSVMLGGDYSAANGSVVGFDILNALSAIRPDLMKGIWEAGHSGDTKRAYELQEKVNKLVGIYFCLRNGMSSSTLFSMSLRLALERKGLVGPTGVFLGFEATDDDRKAIAKILDSVDN